jgi:predicted nuclease of predicted toxin-antitoxin system
MRLLLDECLPKQLKRELPGHQVMTVPEAGLAGVKNGALLRRASERFDVLVTVDANLRFQQNLTGISLGILVLRAVSNDISDLRPLIPAAMAALSTITAGAVPLLASRYYFGTNAYSAPSGSRMTPEASFSLSPSTVMNWPVTVPRLFVPTRSNTKTSSPFSDSERDILKCIS